MPRTSFALAAFFLFTALASADDKTKPAKAKIEAVAINVVRKLDDKQFGFSYEQTQLSLLIPVPGKQLLGVDSTSKVDTFTDDKGASLLVKEGFFGSAFSTFARIARDRESIVVSIQGNRAPTRGATKLSMKGELVALIGTESKTTEEITFEFAKDAKAKLGDMSLEVTSDKGFGSGASFNLKTTGSHIKTVNAKDGDGKTIEVVPLGRFGFGKEWTHGFMLSKELKKGKVSVTYFSKEEKTTIPIDIAVTIGP